MDAPQFQKNDRVIRTAQRDVVGAIVGEARCLAGEWWYDVLFGANLTTCPESYLERFELGEDPGSLFRSGLFGPREALSKIVTFTKLREPLENNLYAYRASRIDFHEYQFKPLVKFLHSPNQRLLIADEVGLGKTIEAALIYKELNARDEMDRVLIVCPSSLLRKWQEELRRRFDEEFDILDAKAVRALLRKLQESQAIVTLRGICSLQTLRSEGILETLEAAAPTLDLVIVDEAHHMRNPETLSNKLGHFLSESAVAMLLLTATPVHLGNENLFQLLRILDPEEFSDLAIFDQLLEANKPLIKADHALRAGPRADLTKCLAFLEQTQTGPMRDRFKQSPVYRDVIRKLKTYDGCDRTAVIEVQRDLAQLNVLGHILTRTRKREVAAKQPKRQASIVRVNWSAAEQNLYDAVTDYCRERAIKTSSRLGVASWFPVINLQRQLASSIPAMLDHYCSGPSEAVAVGREDELSDIESGDVSAETALLEEVAPLMEDRRLVDILEEGRRSIVHDTKLDVLLRHLRKLDQAEPGRKIVLFSYFKKTLNYLLAKLQADGHRCVLITGDVPSVPNDPRRDERGRRIEEFRDDPDVHILLASEVGSEGLDFQFAHILVNYDLPWNPMVVEQRIGRLDRLGQESDRILIYNMSVSNTIEDRVLGRLYARIRIFEESIGDLEEILGAEIQELTLELLRSRLTPAEEEGRIEHCAKVLERRRQEMETLARHAREFIGEDAYFHAQLEEVRKNRRYVTPEELEVLVEDFMAREFQAATWERSKREGCFRLRLDKELADVLRRKAGRWDVDGQLFADRAFRGEMEITCRDDVAMKHRDVELVNGQHLLVQAILDHYAAHPARLHPVACVELASTEVNPGDYGYFLFRVVQNSITPGVTLEPVFVPVTGEAPVPEDKGEGLLSQMVANSRTPDPLVELNPAQANMLHERALAVIAERVTRRRREIERTNADTVSRRLASLEASYQSKRKKKEELLARARGKNARPQYLRMLEGAIRNMDTAHAKKVLKLEEGKKVFAEFRLIAAGIVSVV